MSSETCDFCWDDYNVRTWQLPTTQSTSEMVVGDQYFMQVDGLKKVRVLLVSKPELLSGELRAHVLVLEDNPYVRSGVECRPLAFTLQAIK